MTAKYITLGNGYIVGRLGSDKPASYRDGFLPELNELYNIGVKKINDSEQLLSEYHQLGDTEDPNQYEKNYLKFIFIALQALPDLDPEKIVDCYKPTLTSQKRRTGFEGGVGVRQILYPNQSRVSDFTLMPLLAEYFISNNPEKFSHRKISVRNEKEIHNALERAYPGVSALLKPLPETRLSHPGILPQDSDSSDFISDKGFVSMCTFSAALLGAILGTCFCPGIGSAIGAFIGFGIGLTASASILYMTGKELIYPKAEKPAPFVPLPENSIGEKPSLPLVKNMPTKDKQPDSAMNPRETYMKYGMR